MGRLELGSFPSGTPGVPQDAPKGQRGAQNHSPKGGPFGGRRQHAYKTNVIFTFVMYFCKILNISLEVLQTQRIYYSGRFLIGICCDV